MISQLLTLWQNKNQLDCEGDFVYGVFNEIGFSINDETGGKLLVVSVIASSNENYKKLQELCRLMGGAFSHVKVGKVEQYLALFIDESGYMLTVNDLDAIIQFVATNYVSAGFAAHTVCYKCGQPSSRLVFNNQLVRPVCNSCTRQTERPSVTVPAPVAKNDDFRSGQEEFAFDTSDDDFSVKGRSEEDDHFNLNVDYERNNYDDGAKYMDSMSLVGGSGSPLGGFLGALVGASLGVLPFLLLFSLTVSGVSVAALCLLIPILATVLYKAFHGKKSLSFATLIITIISIAVSSFSILLTQAAKALGEGDAPAGLFYAMGNISSAFSAMDMKDFLIQEVIVIIASVLGVLLLRGSLTNYCED